MPHRLRAEIHTVLHDYRKAVFELEHDQARVNESKERAKKFTGEILDQKFHYHFHQKVDPQRADTIQLIHNYCREALLPPVLERLAEREFLLEERHQQTLLMVERVMNSFAAEVEANDSH